MKKIKLKIDGLKDNLSKDNLLKRLKERKGIKNVELNIPEKILSITYQKINKKKIEDYLEDLDIKSKGEIEEIFEKENIYNGKYIVTLLLMILLLIYSILKEINVDLFSVLFIPKIYSIVYLILSIPFIIFGFRFIKLGFKRLFKFKLNKYLLSLIVIILSVLFNIYSTVMIYLGNNSYIDNIILEPLILIIFFLKTEELLIKKHKNKVKDNLKSMSISIPSEATLKVEDDFKIINIDEIKKDDVLIIHEGERFTCDGIITSGTTSIDESFITGNSRLVTKNVNDKVYAGTINFESKVEYKVENVYKETVLYEIINTKIRRKELIKLIDNTAVYALFITLLLMIIKTLLNITTYNTLQVIIEDIVKYFIVMCPPTLLLITPLILIGTVKRLNKNNILVKDSNKLEAISKVDTIVFDKTGTLTNGIITISKIKNNCKLEDKEIISLVGSMARNIDHPVATGIKRYLKQEKIKPTYNKLSTEYLAGYGIKAKENEDVYYLCNRSLVKKLDIINQYKTDEEELENEGHLVLYLIKNTKIIALVGLKDIVRPNAKKLVATLLKKKYEVIMLTGDNQKTANEIARELGIRQAHGGLSPKDKQEFVKELQRIGKKVLTIGDGMNDIPMLKESIFSLTVETSTNLTSNVSNAVIKKDDIIKILDLINICKKQKKIIKQNIVYTLLVSIFLNLNEINTNSILLTLVISLTIIVINSLRIRR